LKTRQHFAPRRFRDLQADGLGDVIRGIEYFNLFRFWLRRRRRLGLRLRAALWLPLGDFLRSHRPRRGWGWGWSWCGGFDENPVQFARRQRELQRGLELRRFAGRFRLTFREAPFGIIRDALPFGIIRDAPPCGFIRDALPCGVIRPALPFGVIRSSLPCGVIRPALPCGFIRDALPCGFIRPALPFGVIRTSLPCGVIRPALPMRARQFALVPIQYLQPGDLNAGRREILHALVRMLITEIVSMRDARWREVIAAILRMAWKGCAGYGLKDAVGARLEIEGGFAGGKRTGVLRKVRQGIEHLSTLAAAHLPARRTQHLGG
jgi:hypothetical protein